MKVIITDYANDKKFYVNITEDMKKFFFWLEDNYLLCDVGLEDAENIHFTEIE